MLGKGEEIRKWKQVFVGVVKSNRTSTGIEIGIALGSELRRSEEKA